MKFRPTGINVEEKDRNMTITWDDGHISDSMKAFPFC